MDPSDALKAPRQFITAPAALPKIVFKFRSLQGQLALSGEDSEGSFCRRCCHGDQILLTGDHPRPWDVDQLDAFAFGKLRKR